MPRLALCLIALATLVASPGCNCFGGRRPSFMEFSSPCRSRRAEPMPAYPACGPACAPACGPVCEPCGAVAAPCCGEGGGEMIVEGP
jgi:hypothetical protein